jgi:transposase
MHRKALGREQQLKEDIAELTAKLSLRERQLFERRSERGSKGRDQAPRTSEQEQQPRSRGQQPGSRGHGRRRHENLPVREELCELVAAEQVCPKCGLPARPESGTEDSEVIEVEVRAYRRRYRRRRYRLSCQCPEHDPDVPRVITAPPPPKPIPEGVSGIGT